MFWGCGKPGVGRTCASFVKVALKNQMVFCLGFFLFFFAARLMASIKEVFQTSSSCTTLTVLLSENDHDVCVK